jgi:hypothetical protein
MPAKQHVDVSDKYHEEGFIKNFIKKDKQRRLLSFYGSPKNRKKFTSSLVHPKNFDERLILRIDPKNQTSSKIAALLREKGAPDQCYVISEHPDLDMKIGNLSSILSGIVGSGVVAVVSCVPGKLAFYEGEEAGERYLLITHN